MDILGHWLWKIVQVYATPQFTISSVLLHDLRLIYRWYSFTLDELDLEHVDFNDDYIPGRAFTDLFRSDECKRIISAYGPQIRAGGSKWSWFKPLRKQLYLWAAPYYSQPLILDAPKLNLNLVMKNEVIRADNTNGWFSVQEVFDLTKEMYHCDLYIVPSISDIPTILCHARRIPWSLGIPNTELWLNVDEYRDRFEKDRRTPRQHHNYDHLPYKSPKEKLMYGSDGMHDSVFKRRTRSKSVGSSDSRTESVPAVRYDADGNIWRIV